MTRKQDLTAELLVDAHAEVGECPVWDDRAACLWWTDIPAGLIHRTDIAIGSDQKIPVGQPVGAIGLRGSAGLAVAVRDGFGTIDPDNQVFELRTGVEEDDLQTRFNDGKPDGAGRFWAGTMAFDEREGAGALYRLDRDWTATAVLHGCSISNGIDWSVDGRTMYYIDTPTGRIDAFRFDLDRGTLGERSTAFAIPAGMGWPDGLTVDEEGCIWVALWDGWSVARFTPDGRLDRMVAVPVGQVTCPTFGGPDLDLLFVTTAREGFGREGPVGQPHAGGLFVCRPGIRGRQAHRFEG